MQREYLLPEASILTGRQTKNTVSDMSGILKFSKADVIENG